MNIFIPITDEMLELGIMPDELVAYQPGNSLLSQLPTAPPLLLDQSRLRINRSPGTTPSSIAVPALSSSTYLAGALLG